MGGGRIGVAKRLEYELGASAIRRASRALRVFSAVLPRPVAAAHRLNLRRTDQALSRSTIVSLYPKLRLTRGQRLKLALLLRFARVLRSLNLAS
jgi:hypothetical protein